MKIFTLLLILSAALINPLPSTVVNWADLKPGADGSRQFLKGSTDVFESFDVRGEILAAGAKIPLYNLPADEELIIVKTGEIITLVAGTPHKLGPGSIAYFMAGHNRSYWNASKDDAAFYRLRFHAARPDNARRDQAGPSFARDWNKLEKKATDKGFRREVFDRATAMCADFEMHVTTLNAGVDSHAPHTHAQEEIILMLRGKAEMEIDGKRYPITPGSISYVATQVPHALHNTGTDEAEYFAFQWK